MNKTPIYTAQAVRDWESRWFAEGNSSFGLMKQASLAMCSAVLDIILKDGVKQADIIVWCGVGNNGGDGYLTAKYLADSLDEADFRVQIIAPKSPMSADAMCAKSLCGELPVHQDVSQVVRHFDKSIHLDALFGHGLDRVLDESHQVCICSFNAQSGTKIALDMPSGLHPDTGVPLPICTNVDVTLCVMGLKIGLFTGMAKDFVGKIVNLSLIPPDDGLSPSAYLSQQPIRQQRKQTSHKGDFATVAVVGGHRCMGGAVIMASQMAMGMGAGRVTAICHAAHHGAILARSPNIMVADIERDLEGLVNADRVVFGMGLGRDGWSKTIFDKVMQMLWCRSFERVVLDADALYFLAQNPCKLPMHVICTPHSAESARLLGVSVADIDNDKLGALYRLHEQYGGQWVVKGANTLSFDGYSVHVCPFGNPQMAIAGMGDVLAGMLVGADMGVHEVVAWHGIMGDRLASQAMFGIHAHDMVDVAMQLP